jgi:hypothetical protein
VTVALCAFCGKEEATLELTATKMRPEVKILGQSAKRGDTGQDSPDGRQGGS